MVKAMFFTTLSSFSPELITTSLTWKWTSHRWFVREISFVISLRWKFNKLDCKVKSWKVKKDALSTGNFFFSPVKIKLSSGTCNKKKERKNVAGWCNPFWSVFFQWVSMFFIKLWLTYPLSRPLLFSTGNLMRSIPLGNRMFHKFLNFYCYSSIKS